MGKLTEAANPNDILRQTRRDQDLTLDEMADWLGVSTQRIGQWENGDVIPLKRIQRWASNTEFPTWLWQMALQMWLASLGLTLLQFGEQLQALQAQLEK